MRSAVPLVTCSLLLASCGDDGPIATNGFEERIIDREVRHGQGIRMTDVDGDGRLDLVAALSLTDAVHLYLREPTEDPVAAEWTRISVSGAGRIVAMDVDVGDLDGDGDLDIAAVGLFQREIGFTSPGEVVWYENPGDPRGVWTTRRVAVPRLSDDGSRYVGGAYGARAVRIADLDGDGAEDLVVGSQEAVEARFDLVAEGVCEQVPALGNGVHWFRNRGGDMAGTFDGPAAIDPDLAGVSQLRVADVDADGRPDVLATASISQSVVWYRNVEQGGAATFVRRTLAQGGGQYSGLDVANADDDDALEIVAAVTRDTGGFVHLFDPPPALLDNPGALWTTSTVAAGIGAAVCLADEDCARNADLCVEVEDCTFTGTVAEPATPCDPVEVCDNGEDDNGDALVDCEDPTCAANIECLPADACVTELQCANAPAGQMEPLACVEDEDCPRILDVCTDGFCPAAVVNLVVKLADFSGDGRLDVMVAEAGGLLQRYYRQEDGGWERRDIRNGYAGITSLEAGDIDGDGLVDLVTSTYELGTRDRLSWWRNLGN